jgi:hypothetical protein
MSGTIAGNTIGPAKVNANADGIFVRSAGNGTDTVLIQNNTITGYGNAGIHLQNNDGSSTMNASLFGNVLSSPNSQNFAGIFADNGATATDTSTMNLVVGSAQVGEAAKQNTLVGSGGVIDVSLSNFNASTHFNLSRNGSAQSTATGIIQDDNVGSPTVDTSGGAGAITPVNTVPALPPVVAPLLAASGGVQASTPNSGEMHLTQAELDTVVAAAIAQWAAAGASAAQLAALHATTFSIADLTGNTVGEESAPAHITIDTNADGHGWFIDPTPADNSEFTHAANAAGTDLFTDPTNAAAGHLDLLTTVAHEMGHVLGLPDSTSPNDVNDLMYISLVDGERRLPDAADVPVTNTTPLTPNIALGPVVTSEMELSSAYAPVVTGTPGNDTIDAGHGGNILVGGAGADNFVFANVEIHAATPWSLMSALWGGAPPVTPPALTHVADYSFAQGDSFDFSALTSAFHGSGASDAQIVRAVEDPSGTFATLQVNASGPGSIGSWLNMLLQGNANGPWNGTASWVNVAQLDGAHAGDPVNVLVDSQSAIHHAQIHVDLLV